MRSGPAQGGVLLRRRGQHARHDYHERNSKPERFRREGEEAEHGLSPSSRVKTVHPGKACYVSPLGVSEIKPRFAAVDRVSQTNLALSTARTRSQSSSCVAPCGAVRKIRHLSAQVPVDPNQGVIVRKCLCERDRPVIMNKPTEGGPPASFSRQSRSANGPIALRICSRSGRASGPYCCRAE